jgi:hypothetical protein
MKASTFARYAALCGVLAGIAAIGGGLYAHSVQPEFGIPSFFDVRWELGFSGAGSLVGLGIVMVVGGALSLKWPSVGASVVCVAAMVGLVYVFDRGQYRWTPLLYYWGAPWLLAWLTGIFAGYALHARVEPHGSGAAPAATPVGRASATG